MRKETIISLLMRYQNGDLNGSQGLEGIISEYKVYEFTRSALTCSGPKKFNVWAMAFICFNVNYHCSSRNNLLFPALCSHFTFALTYNEFLFALRAGDYFEEIVFPSFPDFP